jgi:hypothetical protein
MVLQRIGAGILDQDDLYADNHGHSTIDPWVDWATGPDGLEWTLNNRCPPAFTESQILCVAGTKSAISRKICWSIHQYQLAPIALVFGWKHWVVVSGYSASAHPTASSDNSYAIESFDVSDPWPPAPSRYKPASAPPPPHTAQDRCGTGGTGLDDRGRATQNIPYKTWKSTYMTGIPGGTWQRMFIAMCDPEPLASAGGSPGPSAMQGSGDEPLPPDKGFAGGSRGSSAMECQGDELLPPDVAVERALAGLQEYGLYGRKDWGRALRGAEPARPILVQRLDCLDSYYWLVPLRKERGTVVVASVDGRWGDYLQAVLSPKPRGNLFRFGPEEALELVAGKRIELGEDRGRLFVRKQALCMYPYLVWRPCRESLSPYYPFYMFTVGDHRLYVRIDGMIFASLTLDPKGL